MSTPEKPKAPEKEYKVALYGFRCLVCGTSVSKGTNYIYVDGIRLCVSCG